MSNALLTQPEAPRLDRSGRKRIVQVIVLFLIETSLLFVAAGRLDWIEAWVYFALRFGALLTIGLWAARKNPGVINERGRSSDNAKSWDKIFGAIYAPLLFIIPIAAGLDAGRYGWSNVPQIWQTIGLLALIPAMILPYWAMAVNPFLVTTVRIQEERGQQVIAAGPYRFVRRPMYVGAILLSVGGPLLLGAAWALIPGGLATIALVVRTALEDRMLQIELPGYKEFTRRTRYRLIPGVW
jgi:protein-S-isoprenylcysteine O-methyltransferase Ste14